MDGWMDRHDSEQTDSWMMGRWKDGWKNRPAFSKYHSAHMMVHTFTIVTHLIVINTLLGRLILILQMRIRRPREHDTEIQILPFYRLLCGYQPSPKP